MPQALIDPSLLIWDKKHFEEDLFYFLDLSESAINAMEFIEKNNVQIYLSEDLRDILLQVFPCSAISEQIPSVHFFVHRVFNFLANNFDTPSEAYLDINDVSNVFINPEPLRNDALQPYKESFYRLYVNSLRGNVNKMISSELIWKIDEQLVINNEDALLGCIKLLKDSEDWRWGIFRRFIPTKKHIPYHGYGTINTYSNELNQHLVETAISLDIEEKVVYNFHQIDSQFLEYRYDNVGGYHGYPIPISEVPVSVIEHYTKDGSIPTGKIGKYKKRNVEFKEA